jgi:hypothetical protein
MSRRARIAEIAFGALAALLLLGGALHHVILHGGP